MYIRYIIILKLLLGSVYAQDLSQIEYGNFNKHIIDTSVLNKWPFVSNPQITNDGRYFSYQLEKQPYNSFTSIIQGVFNTWKKEIIGVRDIYFSANGELAIFKKQDSLYFIKLGSDTQAVIPNVESIKLPYDISSTNCNFQWIAYQLKGHYDSLVLLNLITNDKLEFSSVSKYFFDKKGKTLVVQTQKDTLTCLLWISLCKNKSSILLKENVIWHSKDYEIDNIQFDETGSQAVFTSKVKGSDLSNTMWYYKDGMQSSEVKVDSNTLGRNTMWRIVGEPQFSGNGNYIFFNLQRNIIKEQANHDLIKVSIWSYKDVIIQPEQLRRLNNLSNTFTAAIKVNGSSTILKFDNANERLILFPFQRITGDWVVIMDQIDVEMENWWTLSRQPSFYLMSLKDGTRKTLKRENKTLSNFSFSPNGKYLVYWDSEGPGAWYCYNLFSNTIVNLTRTIPVSFKTENVRGTISASVDKIAGWLENDVRVLLYDNYDIWMLDPTGLKEARNVTKGIGRANHLKFRLVENLESLQPISKDSCLLLTAFNNLNKKNGFYKLTLGKKECLDSLYLGNYLFYRTESQRGGYFYFDNGMKPIKVNNSNMWIVKRQSTAEPPNYYWTEDFRKYIPLTYLNFQKKYYWLTADLINYKQLDGTNTQGILYKPERFDPQKKYPVILNYYEKLTHRLYEFPYPEVTADDLNIPWFVSQGYLVFTPDIHIDVATKTGKVVGECAENSVVAAAKYLSKLPFVNKLKIGIQGHSFGGLLTNYLVSHTHMFAAAAEFAGISDPISAYLTLVPFLSKMEHTSRQSITQRGHEMYNATPWERPDFYRKSSAVLNADKVTTPLLITHNNNDNNIQYRQGVELYMALRRLGKKCWFLNYDDQGHGLQGKEAMDYTLRLTQFFDYYLKDLPPPLWMTEGIPASKKDIIDGLNIDNTRKIP